MLTEKKYWFPAKKYGWGWTFPTCWQGWAVLVGYLASVLALSYWPQLAVEPSTRLVAVFAVTLVLLAILWLKGEPLGSR